MRELYFGSQSAENYIEEKNIKTYIQNRFILKKKNTQNISLTVSNTLITYWKKQNWETKLHVQCERKVLLFNIWVALSLALQYTQSKQNSWNL